MSTYERTERNVVAPQAGATTDAGVIERREGMAVGYRDEAMTRRRDRLRWSAVWAGLAIAVATYLVLQLALIATGAVDLHSTATRDAWLSAGAALIGFFLGGLVTGATAIWRGVGDGVLHGVVMWAVALIALVTLAAVGTGVAVGSFDTRNAFENVTSTSQTVSPSQSQDDAKNAAGRALLGVAAALVAAGVGGALGSKLWPREQEIDLRDSRSDYRTDYRTTGV